VAQAHALGATHVMEYPASRQKMLWLVPNRAGASTLSAETSARAAAKAGANTVKTMFDAVRQGRPIDVGSIESAGKDIATCVLQNGLSIWIDIVRRHHEGTYQHCLLVCGVVTGFGLRLGVHSADLKRLYMAALIHDLGKATIPTEILDKPGKLNAEERALIETHAEAGYDILYRAAGVSDEVRRAVRHHHEFLDGSGYPDGLYGDEIPDLVRVLTISDIFAALIEDRRYRASISRQQAYDVICDMEGKLEKPLLDAFRDVALLD
jgi:putative nucleotidyltransferase with HDIG domain